MARHERFEKAPIREAIIDLKVKAPSGLSTVQIAEIGTEISEWYPTRNSITKGEFTFQFGAGAAAQSSRQDPIGFRFTSLDGHYVLQARLDGLTLSVLPPYDRWETFRDEARRLWSIYRSHVQPESISRLAVRYINQLDHLPASANLEEYLATFPQVSDAMVQTGARLNNYFMQLQMTLPDLQSNLILNQAAIPPTTSEFVSLILDIDLYRDNDVPQDEEGIWALFEAFREHKNAIFIACITDRTKEYLRQCRP